jgi:peptidoglycan/xylan/chitin deacetylase (PgdA/CDA1 family)
MRRRSARFRLLSPCLLALAAGCHHAAPAPAAPQTPPPPPRVSEIDLKTYKPNEAGAIIVVMYHRFNPNESNNALNRTPEQFRRDLQTFYDSGYRPVTVSDIVSGNLDLPAGKSPIALTFDDSLISQFRVVTGSDGKAHIDPDCAVGIMETFAKAHKDWPTKATFFVLPKEGRQGDPFGQPDSVAEKFAYLIKHGYEIGNHTANHAHLRNLGPADVQKAIAVAQKDILEIAPSARVTSFAIPYGELPRKDARPYLVSGEYGRTRYENKAVLLAAWRPILSPFTKPAKKGTGGTLRSFDPYRIERVEPNPAKATMAGTLEFWLKYFEQNRNQRYVSDGNPRVVSAPKACANLVDAARVKALGLQLQIYSASGSLGASGGSAGGSEGSLDVEGSAR